MFPLKDEEAATVEGKTEDSLSVGRDSPADRLKWGGIFLQWDKYGCTRKALTSKAETLTQLLAHHKEQMWRAKKPAACDRPSGQAKYCLSAPPFYFPLAHLYCPWSHIGTLQSLSTGRGIYGGAIRVISSTSKQWPTLVVFDSARSTAGVNGTQQNSTPTTQWCLSLSAKVTSNKQCKQRGPLNADTESKGWCLHRGTATLHSFQMPPAQCGQRFWTQQQLNGA